MGTTGKHVSPAIDVTAFNCPHCGALAKQSWLAVQAEYLAKDQTPYIVTSRMLADADYEQVESEADRDKLRAWGERMARGRPFLEHNGKHYDYQVHNLSFSRCFNCNDISIWISDRLMWPSELDGPEGNLNRPGYPGGCLV